MRRAQDTVHTQAVAANLRSEESRDMGRGQSRRSVSARLHSPCRLCIPEAQLAFPLLITSLGDC